MVIIIFGLCSVIKPHHHHEDNICEPGLDQEKKHCIKGILAISNISRFMFMCLNNFIVLAINIYWSEHCIIKNVIRRRKKCLCGNIVKTKVIENPRSGQFFS